jgi:NDP-sugar pyrophosphorylase family protein
MNLVLTAAGTYERFRRFSYEIPKYLLPVKNRTMLHYVLKGFRDSIPDVSVTFVANKRDWRFAGAISAILDEMCIQWEIKWLDDTTGQAQTLLQATKGMRTNILVHNIDTILLNRSRSNWEGTGADCILDVFESSNRDYSYVVDDDDRKAILIREKSLISTKASSGCYWFSSGKTVERYVGRDTVYISEMINKMIEGGLQDVRTTQLHRACDTIVMGTPQEYLINMDSERLPAR